jgi:hypothetical protein
MIFRKTSLMSGLMTGLALSLVAAAVSPAAWAIQDMAWDPVNAPNRLQPNFSPYFGFYVDSSGNRAEVPKTSHVPTAMMPYDDTYWPSNRGGIANRWNASPWTNPYLIDMAIHHTRSMPSAAEQAKMDKAALEILSELEQMSPEQRAELVADATAGFHYHSPSLGEARRMSREQLAMLSPTEKYDLFRGKADSSGKYEYSLTKEVLGAKTNSPSSVYWQGICHGWAPASVNHAEPLPVDVVNPDGIVIPFGSADVKALLDYMYTNGNSHGILGVLHLGGQSGSVTQMGRRCNTDLNVHPNAGGVACEGVNAGAFHIAMTNYIGIRHVPFVADVAHGREIWNNPVYAYNYEVVGNSAPTAGSAPGTLRRVLVKTTIRYPSDDERLPPLWNPTVGAAEILVPDNEKPLDPAQFNGYRYEEGNYQYWLELGENDRILGGSWESFDRPDYVWMMSKRSFSGDFEDLARIYKPAFSR